MSTLKNLLGVRQTTCNDTVLLELGLPNAKCMVMDSQAKYLTKIFNRQSRTYVHEIIEMAINSRCQMGLQIQHVRENANFVENFK